MKDPDCNPYALKKDFYEWMKTLNELRNGIRKRDTTRFTLKQFYEKLTHYDPVNINILNVDIFMYMTST